LQKKANHLESKNGCRQGRFKPHLVRRLAADPPLHRPVGWIILRQLVHFHCAHRRLHPCSQGETRKLLLGEKILILFFAGNR